MTLNVEKRFLSLLLAFVMVFSLLPWSTVEVSAATLADGDVIGTGTAGKLKIKTDSGNNTYNYTGGDGTYTFTATAAKDPCGNVKNSGHTIKIYNPSSTDSVKFKFQYALSKNGGTCTYNNTSLNDTTSTWEEIELAADGSVSFILSSANSDGSVITLTLRDFSIITSDEYDVTVTYINNMGTVTKDGSTVANGATLRVAGDTGATLVANPLDSYTFLGWYDQNGTALSYNQTVSIKPAENMSIRAKFGLANRPLFSVGAERYDSLKDACAAAEAGSVKTVVLVESGTLPVDEYEIPADVMLLIPFNNAHTSYGASPQYEQPPTSGIPTPKPYKILTIQNGTKITVNGAIEVASKHYSAHGNGNLGGRPIEYYGYIVMQGNSQIILNSGAKLYAWGYISGSENAHVIAESGSTVYEKMQVTDYRGGTATVEVAANRFFPFSQYYVQNVEVKETIKYGAKLIAHATVWARDAQEMPMDFIGENCMFTLGEGAQVTKYYDVASDRLILDAEGNFSFNPISIKFTMIVQKTYNTKDFILPMQQNMTINFLSGNATVNQDILLQPGCIVNIGENASLTIASGKSVYLMDDAEWGTYCCGYTLKQLTYVPTRKGAPVTRSVNSNSKVNVDGTIVVNGQMYASASHASVVSTNKTGVIIYNTAANASDSIIQYTTLDGGKKTLTMTPIMLTGVTKNTDTTGTVVNTTYYYNRDCDMWVTHGAAGHSYGSGVVTAPTCTEKGYTTHTCTVCGYSYTDNEVAAKGHTPNADDGNCTTEITCSVCNAVTTAAKDSHSYGTAAAGDKHNCTVSGCTQKIACSDSDTDKDHVCDFGCGAVFEGCSDVTTDKDHSCDVCGEENITSHSYGSGVVTAPTCTEKGYTTYTCNCGHSYKAEYVEVNPENHVHKSEQVQQDATCLDKGYTAGTYCEDCDKWISGHEEIPAIGHKNKVHHEKVDATCVATGTIEYWSCPDCGKNFSDESCTTEVTDLTIEIDATNHVHKTEHVQQDATCLDKGYTAGTYCEDCDKWISGHEEIPAIGHKNKEHHEKVDATCVATGTIEYWSCPDCGKNFSDESCTTEVTDLTIEIDATNHVHKTEHVQQDATCLDKGYTAGTYCEDCDKWISGHEEIPAIGHKNKEHHEKVDATCVATGTIEYWSCPDCGKNFSDESCTTEVTDLTIEIDATNHVHKTEHVQQDATCLDKGYTAGTYCEDCDKWISGHEEIPAIGHKNKEHHEKVDATCVATGTIEYWSCPDCGKNFSDESCTTEVTDLTIEIDATNHVHKTEHVQQDATCLDKGYTAGTYCEDCDKWISGHEEIPAIGHSYSAVVTKPTCEDGGYTTYTCNCGHTYTADHTKQLGHAWGEPKYIINDDGTHTETYTCGNDATHFKSYAPVKHIYTNGMCDCGAIWLEVKAVGSMNYVVDGQTVKVVHDKPCRVGYLLDGSYVAITGVANGDGSYSFTAPAGVTEVLVVEKGEVNGDGRISAPDVARINAHILNKITLTAEALFAADANGDGFVNSDDLSVLSYAVLGKESLAWELTSTEH